eukprot:754108-Hanusia_phi.AAC.2
MSEAGSDLHGQVLDYSCSKLYHDNQITGSLCIIFFYPRNEGADSLNSLDESSRRDWSSSNGLRIETERGCLIWNFEKNSVEFVQGDHEIWNKCENEESAKPTAFSMNGKDSWITGGVQDAMWAALRASAQAMNFEGLKKDTFAATTADEALYDVAVIWTMKRAQRLSTKEAKGREQREMRALHVQDVIYEILSGRDDPNSRDVQKFVPLLPKATTSSASQTRHCSPLYLYRFTNVEDMKRLPILNT